MRTGSLALGVVVLIACEAGVDPAPSLSVLDGQTAVVTLRVGETATINGIAVSFSGVPGDSRCATDVLCPAPGNAVVELIVEPAAGFAPAGELWLNTTEGPRSAEALGLRLTLNDLQPAPVSTQVIRPEDYVASLTAESATP